MNPLAVLTGLTGLINSLPDEQREALQETVGNALRGTEQEKGLLDSSLENARKSLVPPTENEIQERIKRYKVSPGEFIGKAALNTGADVASIVGDYQAAKQSLLGDALLSMSHVADSPGYVNPLTAAVAPVVAGNVGKGLLLGAGGKAASSLLRNISDEYGKAKDMDRNTELLIRESPNTGYYNLQRHRETVRENS